MAENKNHTFSGKIAKTSAYGFQLEQHLDEDRWLNFGKFYEGLKPIEGDIVSVDVQEREVGDKTYWNIKNVETSGDKQPPKTGQDNNRQVLIVRQSSWKIAIEYAIANKMSDISQIAEVAHSIESDVMRPEIHKDDIPF